MGRMGKGRERRNSNGQSFFLIKFALWHTQHFYCIDHFIRTQSRRFGFILGFDHIFVIASNTGIFESDYLQHVLCGVGVRECVCVSVCARVFVVCVRCASVVRRCVCVSAPGQHCASLKKYHSRLFCKAHFRNVKHNCVHTATHSHARARKSTEADTRQAHAYVQTTYGRRV